VNGKTKKPLTTEERQYINTHLNGNRKKAEKKEKRFVDLVDRRNECLAGVELLAKLPGTEEVRKALVLKINTVKVIGLDPDDFKTAIATFERVGKEVRRIVATQLKTGLAKGVVDKQNAILAQSQPLLPGRAAGFEQEVSRGVLHGGAGPKFKKVTGAMKDAEKDSSEKNLKALETAAQAYLNGFDEGDVGNDEKTLRKAEICRNALLDVAAQRKYAKQIEALGTPPWDTKEETAARALNAKMLLERNPAKKLGQGESGASESFFIPGKEGEKAFIFKPGDGEHVSGHGWQKGGGAPREVMVSAINEQLKESGLDCGVGRTSLMKLNHASISTPSSGGHTERVGAAQDFVASNGKPYGDYIEHDENGKRCLLPKNEVQKVLLLDFVTLQLDRNDGNMLFQDGEDGQPKVVPIDAGNALPNRAAFESRRRTFTAGALFDTPHAAEPFSPEMLSSIENMDADKIAAGMTQANQTMGEVDPSAPGMIPDESIEMVRRSVQFLKKAVGRLKSPKQLGEAYQFTLQKVFDASPDRIDQAIEAAITETLRRAEQFEQLEQMNYKVVLLHLGWPTDNAEFFLEDPAYLLDLMQNQRPNPAALKRIAELTQELGGPVEAAKLIPSFGTGTVNEQSVALSREFARQLAKPEFALQREGGDAELQKAGIDATDMTPKDKAAKMWQIIYEREGGDAEIERLRAMGFANIPKKTSGGNPSSWVPEMRAWKEYERLGGADWHVEVGGSGPPGGNSSPTGLLANMRLLASQHEVRRDEVKAKLVQAQQFIQAGEVGVKKLLGDALTLYDKAQGIGALLPAALKARDLKQIGQLCHQIATIRDRLQGMIDVGDTESKRLETELFKILPDDETAAKFGEKAGRKQIIENGLYRLQADLTATSKGFPNYANWLTALVDIERGGLKGALDPLAAYRVLGPNDAKKLFRQEWPPIGGADARIPELLKSVKKRTEDTKTAGATPELLKLIQLDFRQLDEEMERTTTSLDNFGKKLQSAVDRYPPNVRQMATQANPSKEDAPLVTAMKDLGELEKLAATVRLNLTDYAKRLFGLRESYVGMHPLPQTPTRPTGTGGDTAPTQTTPTTPTQNTAPQQDEEDDVVLLPPEEPRLLDQGVANPTLYFHPNTANDNNYIVAPTQPDGQWQKVEQFCAYLATQWLADTPGGGGLKFSGLRDKQAAIQTLIDWGSTGGLAAQVGHARATLKGTDGNRKEVVVAAAKNELPVGTKIWFGSNNHAEAAFVAEKNRYAVYDPNTGGVVNKTGMDFAKYAQKASAFVLA
jgi:hypothetical protein